MEDNSTIGIMPEHESDEKKSRITPEDIAAVCKHDNGLDVWPFLLLALLPSFWGNNSSADYWRGKYDALKETMGK